MRVTGVTEQTEELVAEKSTKWMPIGTKNNQEYVFRVFPLVLSVLNNRPKPTGRDECTYVHHEDPSLCIITRSHLHCMRVARCPTARIRCTLAGDGGLANRVKCPITRTGACCVSVARQVL